MIFTANKAVSFRFFSKAENLDIYMVDGNIKEARKDYIIFDKIKDFEVDQYD